LKSPVPGFPLACCPAWLRDTSVGAALTLNSNWYEIPADRPCSRSKKLWCETWVKPV